MGLYFCIAAFALSFLAVRRSLGLGVSALLALGYAYGIVRANFGDTFSHFIFDAGCAGLYMGAWSGKYDVAQRLRVKRVWKWVIALTAWPLLLLFVPFQDFLVQLVGFRAAIFFVPAVLIGALLDEQDLEVIALNLAILNLIALAFASIEYFNGIEMFYPRNPVTYLLYRQNDVAVGHMAYFRLPGTFPTPAGYGGTMVASLPILINGILKNIRRPLLMRLVLLAGTIAAIVGVFLCASRTCAAMLFFLGAVFALSGGLPVRNWVSMAIVVAAMAWLVGT